eukprot:756254-Hanusia_phi.AAC.3
MQGDVKMYNKFCGKLCDDECVRCGGIIDFKFMSADKKHIRRSPFDVVAWHGNYLPFKYNLKNFCTMNTVSYDHPGKEHKQHTSFSDIYLLTDPSIFTVLSCPSEIVGESAVDFVIFPTRWMVAEHTFRPPYFHRNYMSEFMGMVMLPTPLLLLARALLVIRKRSAHGPDKETTERAEAAELGPAKFEDGLAFMFETSAASLPSWETMTMTCSDRSSNQPLKPWLARSGTCSTRCTYQTLAHCLSLKLTPWCVGVLEGVREEIPSSLNHYFQSRSV